MSLFNDWKELAEKERKQAEHDLFWGEYLEQEKKNYEYILNNSKNSIEGSFKELADKFKMDSITFMGFMDGINTSLVSEYNLDDMNEETKIKLEIDFEKLYFNMLDAKAAWLYTLPQWDGVLPEDKRKQITKDFHRGNIVVSTKVGRNDPCPCGSGKKYKQCCG